MLSPRLRLAARWIALAAPLLAACASAPSGQRSAEGSAAAPAATPVPAAVSAAPAAETMLGGKPVPCALRMPPARKAPAFRFKPANYTHGRTIKLDSKSIHVHPVGDEMWAWDSGGGTPIRRYDALWRETHTAFGGAVVGAPLRAPIAVEGGAVLGVSGVLLGMDGSSGRIRWTRRLAQDTQPVEPVASLGNLVVATAGFQPSTVHLIDGTTGDPCWDTPLHLQWSADQVLLTDRLVIVNTAKIIALDRETGRTVWERPRQSHRTKLAMVGGGLLATIWRSAYDISRAEGVEHLDPASGAPVVRLDFKPITNFLVFDPAGDGTVFTTEHVGRVPGERDNAVPAAWSVPKRRAPWKRTTPVFSRTSSIVAFGGAVLGCTQHGRVRALDAASGELIWSSAVLTPIARDDDHECQLYTVGETLFYFAPRNHEAAGGSTRTLTALRNDDVAPVITPVTITGRVRLNTPSCPKCGRSQPAKGAVVQVGDVTAMTDAEGRYRLTVNLEAGVKEVKVSVNCTSFEFRSELAARQEELTDWRGCDQTAGAEGFPARLDFNVPTWRSPGKVTVSPFDPRTYNK